MRALSTVVLASALLAAACSADPPDQPARPAPDTPVRSDTVLAVDDLPAAVAAVEAERGGPQRYTEINVIPDGVNLFVALSERQEVSYFHGADGLEEPSPPQPASGTAFELGDTPLDLAGQLVRDVQTRFPGAEVVSVALVEAPDLGLVWALRSRSSRGGVLEVLFSSDGRLLSVAPA